MEQKNIERTHDDQSESMEVILSDLPIRVNDLISGERRSKLLHETLDDLFASYFSTDNSLEHRTSVYDNCKSDVYLFLMNRNDFHVYDKEQLLRASEIIVKYEKIDYQNIHWPDGSPVSEPLAITGELDKIIGSAAMQNTVYLGQQTSPSVISDEFVVKF